MSENDDTLVKVGCADCGDACPVEDDQLTQEIGDAWFAAHRLVCPCGPY